jgi:predicted regulator of Ras-like GTPase activity (Roadblock/LC7/MglB family)
VTVVSDVEVGAMAIDVTKLEVLLQQFVANVSHVQGAAIVSPDGLALASSLPSGMDEERVAAMSAAMLSLGERIGRELKRGEIARVLVEGEQGYGILTSCTEEAVFLILADHDAKLGIINLEIKNVVGEIRKQLLGLAQPVGL